MIQRPKPEMIAQTERVNILIFYFFRKVFDKAVCNLPHFKDDIGFDIVYCIRFGTVNRTIMLKVLC
jgi:hypothetical protein